MADGFKYEDNSLHTKITQATNTVATESQLITNCSNKHKWNKH